MRLDKIALVLEGGGMRGMFSAACFRSLSAQGLSFPLYYCRFCRSLHHPFLYV